MRTTSLAGILLGILLTCAASPLMAQDQGKTAATELASASRAALKQLTATVPLAKTLAPGAHAILVGEALMKHGNVGTKVRELIA